MSGDCGPSVCVPAALAAARDFPDVRFTLVGRQADLERELVAARAPAEHRMPVRRAGGRDDRSSARGAAAQEGFLDAPRHRSGQGGRGARLRQRRQHRRADGDGAFRAQDAAGRRAPRDRLASSPRAADTPTCSISAPTPPARPSSCCQFAVMGSVLAADLEGAHERPRVGLLNIGEEDIKGNETVQSAHNLIAAERRQLRRLRRGARHLFRQGGRRGHRRLHGQRRAEDHGRRRAADHRRVARGIHANSRCASWGRSPRVRPCARCAPGSTRAATMARRWWD